MHTGMEEPFQNSRVMRGMGIGMYIDYQLVVCFLGLGIIVGPLWYHQK